MSCRGNVATGAGERTTASYYILKSMEPGAELSRHRAEIPHQGAANYRMFWRVSCNRFHPLLFLHP